jgi:hypothetical protein
VRGTLVPFFVATAQGQPQFALKLLKIGKFSLDISHLLLQSAPHRRTAANRLRADSTNL